MAMLLLWAVSRAWSEASEDYLSVDIIESRRSTTVQLTQLRLMKVRPPVKNFRREECYRKSLQISGSGLQDSIPHLPKHIFSSQNWKGKLSKTKSLHFKFGYVRLR